MASSEQNLIDRIRKQISSAEGPRLRLGIGDDAAILRPAPGTEWVISCDQFIEGVHFLADKHPPRVVGYRALARATSDLAAMGARPRFFLLSLMLPANRTGAWLDRMLTGMSSAARSFGLIIAGGDTSRSPDRTPGAAAHSSGIVFSITVLGDLPRGEAIRRSGARSGDAIFVTGQVGAAQLGLEIILRGLPRRKSWTPFLAAHNYPRPGIEIGQWLARRKLASAMVDLSDGLSSDLTRLCQASGVSARIIEETLPSVMVPPALQLQGIHPRALALHGGEDYGLLFTVPKRKTGKIPAQFDGMRITRIGDIVSTGRNPGVQLISVNGAAIPLAPKGWDPFARNHKRRIS